MIMHTSRLRPDQEETALHREAGREEARTECGSAAQVCAECPLTDNADARNRIHALHITDPVFCHHLYEFERGLRDLILHTTERENLEAIRKRLERNRVAYEIYPLKYNRINVFFGSDACVQVIRTIGKPCLQDYTPEEDFILGTMLGYSRHKQCERYLKMKDRHATRLPELAG